MKQKPTLDFTNGEPSFIDQKSQKLRFHHLHKGLWMKLKLHMEQSLLAKKRTWRLGKTEKSLKKKSGGWHRFGFQNTR